MNNYHIYEEIGKGKYSVVYKGRKKKTIEYMAVKGLEKSRRPKLLNEVKMFTGLKHQNLLRFHHWYETQNHLWVILEYCPGGDLMSLIEADPKGLSEPIVVRFLRDMAAGLNYLHSKGIVYCDLRPSNVLFNEYGIAKLSDLGNARRLVDMISATLGPDIEMSKRGSPYYMAPELFQEGGVYSFQSDLWALGCIAYELCSGQPPFQSSSFTELVDLILNADFKPLDLPVFELIRGLLEKDPTKRWGWEKIARFLSIQPLKVPSQAHFETWCKKNIAPSQRATPQAQSGKQVDIVRLSLNVHKNLLREDTSAPLKQYHKHQNFKLVNKDQEILIGDDNNANDEDDDSSNPNPNHDDQPQHFDSNHLSNFNSPHVQKQQLQLKKDYPSTTSLLNQSPIPGGVTPQQKKLPDDQLVPIDQLFNHSTDNQVKPIIGNREIEKSVEASFLKENLPFPYITPEDVHKAIETDQMDLHFEQIYNALTNNTISQNDKLNILNYFEQLIQSSKAADRLLNSAFVPLLLKLTKLSKISQMKHRLCSVLGLLIRHATLIENEVASVGIVEGMIEILNSKEQNVVRRKAAAALGEFLFYGATEMEKDPANPIWEMTSQSFNCLIKSIKSSSEDEIVKFYCIKVIENISAQSIVVGQRFATQEVILLLLQCFNQTKNESLRVSCSTALANLLQIDNNLVDIFVQNLGLKNLVSIFIDNLQRVQQNMITIFNLYLLQSLSASESSNSVNVSQVAANFVNKLLMEEFTLIKGLVFLLDHGNHASRGKASIALMLMIRFNMSTLLHLTEEQLRFFQILDKALRDNNEYLKSCLQHLVQQLQDCIGLMFQVVNDSLAQSEEPNSGHHSKSSNKKISGNQAYLNVLLHYSQTPSLQLALFSSQNLPLMTQLLNSSSKHSQVQTILFNIMSNMCVNQRVLIKQQQIIIQQVLKNSIDYMMSQEIMDSKYMFLKLITELISALLQEEGVYDYPSFLKPFAQELNSIIITQILPLLKQLFQESPPLPFCSLKLASILLTYNAHFLPHFKKNKVLQIILDMFRPESKSITGHTLNIVQKIIEGSSIEEVNNLGLLEKSIQIFINFVQQNYEWAFEDLSQIIMALTTKIITEFQRSNNKSVVSPDNAMLPQPFPQELLFFQDVFLLTLPSAAQLLINTSPACQQTILTYLLHLTYFYPGKLTQYRQSLCNQLVPLIQPILAKKIVKLIHWLLILNEPKQFKLEKRDVLIQLLEKMAKEDKAAAQALKDIPRYLL